MLLKRCCFPQLFSYRMQFSQDILILECNIPCTYFITELLDNIPSNS